jgi:hypothetical protein
MLLCPTPRSNLLRFLPRGGEVAEIGVAKGDFSQEILAVTAPRRLHLIDPWVHQARDDYTNDPNNVSDAAQDDRYVGILDRFHDAIAAQQVCVHRAYSEEAADLFEPQQFDWIYIDAMHTSEAVYRDLVAYHDTVKREGLIVGHDYTNHVQARSWNFGVVEAVNRFVADFKYEFVALTLEAFPTYVLSKQPQSSTVVQLTERLIAEVPYVIEIRDYPKRGGFEHRSLTRDGKLLVYPSF